MASSRRSGGSRGGPGAGGARGSRPPVTRRPRPSGPSPAESAEAVRAIVEPVLAETVFDLEDVVVTRAGNRHIVAVAVDKDGGLDLDAVAEVSRLVSEALDAQEASLPPALRDAYTLEVSSRGAAAPLQLPRHWRRSLGRLVEVRRRGGQGEVTGRITAVDDDGADLDVDGATVRVEWDEVARAVVQLEFKRPPGVDPPEDTDDIDADEEEDDDTDEEEDDGGTP
jgi:ribosome maturation factor RimP